MLAELGRKDEAIAQLDVALAQRPDLAVAWYGKSYLARHVSVDADIHAIEEIVKNPNLPYRDRVHLHFALGKSYLDVGDGKKAFGHLDQGNAFKRALLDYDPIAEASSADGIIAAFPKVGIPEADSTDADRKRPIFIFGMPRSGTTLVEQILASHPLVDSIGESIQLEKAAARAVQAHSPRAGALLYFRRTGANRLGKPCFVDKMPENFRHAGFIAAMFPGARMIHCRRDALDTCFSCYSTLFSCGHAYSYDMAELGNYYGVYRRLMLHWDSVMPADAILHIDYEALVCDTRAQVKRMLDYCTLSWDDNCLRFYETKRLVLTASFDQVRSPIYRSSIGRAGKFQPWLGPLEAALKKNTKSN